MNKVRISIANIASYMSYGTTRLPMGILNRSDLVAGRLVYKAIGGSAEMTSIGKIVFEFGYKAVFDGNDARLIVDEKYADKILKAFERREPLLYEVTIRRELREELTLMELPGQTQPILSTSQAARLRGTWKKSVRQTPLTSGNTSSAKTGSTPTYRLLNIFEIAVPADLVPFLTNCPTINGVPVFKAFTDDEMNAGRTTDGVEIGGNIFR